MNKRRTFTPIFGTNFSVMSIASSHLFGQDNFAKFQRTIIHLIRSKHRGRQLVSDQRRRVSRVTDGTITGCSNVAPLKVSQPQTTCCYVTVAATRLYAIIAELFIKVTFVVQNNVLVVEEGRSWISVAAIVLML